MAIVFTKVNSYPDLRKAVYDVTLDASYPAAGYAVTPANFGMITVDNVVPIVSTTEAVTPTYTAASGKLKLYKTGSALSGVLLEIASTDVSASTKIRCDVTGNPVL